MNQADSSHLVRLNSIHCHTCPATDGLQNCDETYDTPLAFGFLSLVWLASPPSEHCSHGGDDGNAAHFGVISNLLLTIYNP